MQKNVELSVFTDEIFEVLAGAKPNAIAKIRGGNSYPLIRGFAHFYDTSLGCLCMVLVQNLPLSSPFLGLHIHEKGICEGDFGSAGTHFGEGRHPYHKGDLPPLLNSNGYAYAMFLDSNFTTDEIIGRAIVVHSMRDDFESQPAGDSGLKIACGVINKMQ